MTRDVDTLHAVGQAMFGPAWQRALSRALDVDERTVRRWAAGDFEIHPDIWSRIAKICHERGATLEQWAKKLVR